MDIKDWMGHGVLMWVRATLLSAIAQIIQCQLKPEYLGSVYSDLAPGGLDIETMRSPCSA